MPINSQDVINAAAMLADNHNLRATVQQSGKGALICGACCFVGGLIGGPVGLAVGGTVGGITAYRTTGNFRPVGDIIRNDLSAMQQERLYEHIVNAVRQIEPIDVLTLAPLLMGSASVQQAVLKTVISFISNELKMQIAN